MLKAQITHDEKKLSWRFLMRNKKWRRDIVYEKNELLTWYMAVLGRSRQTAQHKTEPNRDSNFSSFLCNFLLDVSNFCFFASGSSKLCFEILGILLSASEMFSTACCCVGVVVGITEIVAVVEADESEEEARFSTRISAVIRLDENELVEGRVATESAIFIVS